MSYDFIQKLYDQITTQNVQIENCPKPFLTLVSGVFLMFTTKSFDYNKNGLKFHVRIADEDIHEALKIVAQTVQKHNIGFFKVAHRPFSASSQQHGKQFTIYIDETKMNPSVLNAFTNDLETRLAKADIRPNEIGKNMKKGDRLIPNSTYLSYRYDKSEYLIDTPKKLYDFLKKHNIPYKLDDDNNPRFVYINPEIAKELVKQEYLVLNNVNNYNAPIVIFDSNQAHIQLKNLTSSRPSNISYKPPLINDVLANVEIRTQQNCIIYNTGYCEVLPGSVQSAQKIKNILNQNNIEYVTITKENTSVIRMPYTQETEKVLTENKLTASTSYAKTDNTRLSILNILDYSPITQYTSTGRIELAIPTRYSELRNEMITILKQQGIHPQKLKDNYTGQYFLSFPQTRSSLNFVKALKHARLSTVPNDYMPVKNTQRT